MTGIIEQYYAPLLKKHGFVPEPDNDQYGPLGLCWKLSPEVGEGSYWTYGQRDLFDIKIHNFSFNKDFMLEFDLPECLSITRYDSISGEELSPYRRLSAGCIKTYVGGYKPYQVIVHKNIPVRSIGIEITPAYYEDYLKKQYPEVYRNPVEAFREIDQTTDFPEMYRLLSELQSYRGTGIAAKLYYESKVAEALSLVVEYQKKRSVSDHKLASQDLERIQTVAAYLSDHYAGEVPIERLAQIDDKTQKQLQEGLWLHDHRVYTAAPHESGRISAGSYRSANWSDCSNDRIFYIQPVCGTVSKKHRLAPAGVQENGKAKVIQSQNPKNHPKTVCGEADLPPHILILYPPAYVGRQICLPTYLFYIRQPSARCRISIKFR